MEELSIIIPVYNGQNHLAMCLDSLINQIDINAEIIIINDCSSDNTSKIIDNYAHIYEKIKIINMEINSGSGICRNEGIKKASGKYIGFVDSDDWVDLNFYSSLIQAIQSEDCDIAIAGIADEYNNSLSSAFRYNYENFAVIDGRTALRLLTKSYNLGVFISPIMNNKIYKAEMIKEYDIKCCDNKTWQDDYFSFFATLYSKKICLVPDAQYHYYQHDMSVTHNGTSSISKIDNCIDVLVKIREDLHRQNIYTIYAKEYQAFVERCISSLLVMLRHERHLSLNDNLIYLYEKITESFNIKDIISYIDNERIYKFFNL